MINSTYPDIEKLGLYSPEAAARLIRTRANRVRYWFKGTNKSDPLWIQSATATDQNIQLSFIDLLQVRMVELLLGGGYKLSAIRKAIEYGQNVLEEQFPLLSKRLHLEMRKEVGGGFIHFQSTRAMAQTTRVTGDQFEQSPTGQLILRGVLDVKPVANIYAAAVSLQSSVEYLQDRPIWKIAPTISANVVADPKRNAGVPILMGRGLPISVIAEQASIYSDQEVADDFEISVEDVQDAKRFTRHMAEPIPLRHGHRTSHHLSGTA